MRKFKYTTVVYKTKSGEIDESLNPKAEGGISVYISDAATKEDHSTAVIVNLPKTRESEIVDMYDRFPQLYGITCFAVSFDWMNRENLFKDVDDYIKENGYIRC